MARPDANDIAEKLAGRAEAVCRTYLPKGRKAGNYWMIGDATGTPGSSMYVRLRGPLSGKGAAGKWSDAATGDHGNLLDLIGQAQGLSEFRDILAEAMRFLNMPDPVATETVYRSNDRGYRPGDARAGAVKLFGGSQPLRGTLGETYLASRGIALGHDFGALRFHPRAFYGKTSEGRVQTWPTLVAAVSNTDADVTGISRTFLARDGKQKAPVEDQRRSKGDLLGNGIRFSVPDDVMAAGEGLETTLSIRVAMLRLPLIAATSANHLSAILFPETLRTLIVIRDNDHAGDAATDALFARGQAAGIDVVLIEPELDDLNSDLTKLGKECVIHRVREQLPQRLIERFMV